MSRGLGVILACALALGGCVGTPPPSLQAIDRSAIEIVQAEIKRQIGVYLAKAEQRRRQPAGPAVARWCGDGSIDYDVVSVKVDLATTDMTNNSANAGLKIPVLTGGKGSIGPSVSTSRTVTNSQELVYTEYMLGKQYQPAELMALPPDTSKPSPIADLMDAQRTALIDAAIKVDHPYPQPCFTNFDPSDPSKPQSTVTIGVKFESDDNGGIKVDLVVLSFGASVERKGSFANTITVTYGQRGLTKDSFIADCAPDDKSPCVWEPEPKLKPAPPATANAGEKPKPGISVDGIAKKRLPMRRRGGPPATKPSAPVSTFPAPTAPEPAPAAKSDATTTPPTQQCRRVGKIGIQSDCPKPAARE